MIVYEQFWKTLKKKNKSQYYLLRHGIGSSVLKRIKKGDGITTHSINKLCELLDCEISDILEYKKEKDVIQSNT